MAGIINTTARQYNIKAVSASGHYVTVRLAPGYSEVVDKHWKHCKDSPFVKELIKAGKIQAGPSIDDLLLDRKPDTIAKSKMERKKAPSGIKSETEVQAKAEIKAEIKAELKAELKASLKAEAELAEKAEALKAKLAAKVESVKVKLDGVKAETLKPATK